MPPTSEPELVEWLLLFIPGLVALEVAGFYGRPTTQRGTLQWIVYGVLISLALELVTRIVLDPFVRPWIDAVNHPVRRSGVLLVLGVATGIAIGWLQRRMDRWQQRSWKARGTAKGKSPAATETGLVSAYRRAVAWFMAPRTARRVWIAFFKYQGWVRVELTNDQVLMGWARYYSDDPGDAVRELMLEAVHLKRDGVWKKVDATLYLDSSQIRSVLRAATRAALEEADRVLAGVEMQPAAASRT